MKQSNHHYLKKEEDNQKVLRFKDLLNLWKRLRYNIYINIIYIDYVNLIQRLKKLNRFVNV